MNERERHIIRQMDQIGPFNDLYSHGLRPDEVKEALVALFKPYSLNHQALSKYVVNFMVGDAISLASILDNQWAIDLLTEALQLHREALQTDRAASLNALAAYLERINHALSIFWSQYHLARDVDTLDLEEFVHETLRVIGVTIEGTIKPLLYAMVHQTRIARGRHTTTDDVNALSLGNVVEEIMQRAADSQHFLLRGLRLNQWRNIAQHFTTRLDMQTIVCEYNDGKAEIRLSRSELRQVLNDTLAAYKALKVAHVIVFFDSYDELSEAGLLPKPDVRAEASLVVLVSALASQGFEVVEIECSSEESRLVVKDISRLDPNERRIHTTQFVIPLYYERQADRVVIEYWERDGTPSLRTIATREMIERAEREGDWKLVALEAELINLKGKA